MRRVECSKCGHRIAQLEPNGDALQLRVYENGLVRTTHGFEDLGVRRVRKQIVYDVTDGEIVRLKCECGTIGEITVRPGAGRMRTIARPAS